MSKERVKQRTNSVHSRRRASRSASKLWLVFAIVMASYRACDDACKTSPGLSETLALETQAKRCPESCEKELRLSPSPPARCAHIASQLPAIDAQSLAMQFCSRCTLQPHTTPSLRISSSRARGGDDLAEADAAVHSDDAKDERDDPDGQTSRRRILDDPCKSSEKAKRSVIG